MSVAEMERRFYELKGKLDVGAIQEDEFKAEIEKLRFQDAQNRWWMIGAQSGKWYMYDGTRWLPGQPPAEPVSSLPLSPSPVSDVPAPVPAPAPAPAVARQAEATPPLDVAVPQTEGSTPPARAAADLAPERLGLAQAARAPVGKAPRPMPRIPLPSAPRGGLVPPPFKLPGKLPILIGCGAMVALVVVVLLVGVAVENLVPGKPLSSAVARVRGTDASKTVVVTRGTPPATGANVGASGIGQLMTVADDFVLQSQFDPAISQYQAAAQMAPANPLPLSRWARALALRGQTRDALARARQGVQRAASDAEAQAQLTRALAWNGQTAEAVVAGEKAVQLDPKSANAHAFLAEAYLLVNRAADAQTQAQLAVQLAPQGAEAHRAQAWVLTLAGQKDNALVEWRQTIAFEPNLSFRHFEFGEVLRVFFNDPVNAASEYQKAIALYGAYIPAHSRLGMAYLDANLPQQAVGPFQRAITLDRNNASHYAYLGVALSRANGCAQGIPYFEQALRMEPDNAVASKGLSDCRSDKTPSTPAGAAPTTPLTPPTVVPSANAPVVAPIPTPGRGPYPYP